jgi:hypothetical protein
MQMSGAPLPPLRVPGWAWVSLALAIAVHVLDEAAHDFLALYNPTVEAIRRALDAPGLLHSFGAHGTQRSGARREMKETSSRLHRARAAQLVES